MITRREFLKVSAGVTLMAAIPLGAVAGTPAPLLAKQLTPTGRTWTVMGNPAPRLAAIDDAAQSFMQANGVRAGTLAVAKNGDFLYSRAYTWAEPDYAITQPQTLLRVASVSKAFTAAAVQKAYDTGLLTPQTLAFPTLGITSATLPGQTVDPRVNTITVDELVNHTGGWDDSISNFDPTFNMREIAQALGLNGPTSNLDLARYMYGEPLQFAPGTGTGAYSNFGYALLGMLLEQVSGKSYFDFLNQQVLAPLGITEVAVSPTRASQRLPSEGFYDAVGDGLTALAPNSNAMLPPAYGGGDFLTDVDVADGGLAASSHAVVNFIHRWIVWGIGPRPAPGNWELARVGSLPGTSSLAESRGTDGVDFAFIVNTSDFPPGAGDVIGNFSTTLESILDSAAI